VIGERFGGQTAQTLGADEHRSERIVMRERGAQEATTQMGCMDAEHPSIISSARCL
jgi:hypothetical protein